ETGHAHGHLEYLEEVGDPATGEPIGDTEKNLKAAVAGETYEYTQMYPGFAKQAREDGFVEIAEWFETLAKAEKSHAGRFAKGLQTLQTLWRVGGTGMRLPIAGQEDWSQDPHGMAYDNPQFWDSRHLQSELHRVFEICNCCRLCFNLC